MKTTDFQRTVQEVYAVGATLYVDTFGGLSVEGEIPRKTKKYIREHKDQFRQMLTGDPLMGFGWEGRSALFEQAIRWLEKKTRAMDSSGEAHERAETALTSRVSIYDNLNAAWCDGSFEDYRDALKEYIQIGIDAAKGKKIGTKLRTRT